MDSAAYRILQQQQGLSQAELAFLQTYQFNAAAFVDLQTKLSQGYFTPERNYVQEPLRAAQHSDFLTWPQANNEATTLGLQALQAGQVAMVVLNGGMATRFGGRVKGVVEALPQHSFLALKLRPLRQQPHVAVFLMNSFATAAATRAHLQDQQAWGLAPEQLHEVLQTIGLRLQPDAQLWRDAQAQLGYYAPGHADILAALQQSSAFQAFMQQGGRYVMLSNVDNLAATLEPSLLGLHIQQGASLTCEVVPSSRGDQGGAPFFRRHAPGSQANVAERLEIVENFRLPPALAASPSVAFNTNTFWLNAHLLATPYPFTWFRADKQVAQQPVVQFERLLGELTSFVPTQYVLVPRDAAHGRFLPVKTPQDLQALQPLLQARFLPT